jgi:hypothetical protein
MKIGPTPEPGPAELTGPSEDAKAATLVASNPPRRGRGRRRPPIRLTLSAPVAHIVLNTNSKNAVQANRIERPHFSVMH